MVMHAGRLVQLPTSHQRLRQLQRPNRHGGPTIAFARNVRLNALGEDGVPGISEPQIIVVGLGPGEPRHLTREAWEVLTGSKTVHVRTKRHPTLEGLPKNVRLEAFDGVYERTTRLEDVYPAIAEELLTTAAGAEGEVVYAVPGDPCVAENSVSLLRQMAPQRGVSLRIVPGLSFLEPMLAAIGTDVMPSLAIHDAIDVANTRHATLSVDTPVLLCQLYSKALASDVKLALMNQYPEDWEVSLVHAAGTDTEVVELVPLHDIDRSPYIDILSSLHIPALPVAGTMEALLNHVATVRDPTGGGQFTTGVGKDEEGLASEDNRHEAWVGEDGAWELSRGESGGVWQCVDPADEEAVEGVRAAANSLVEALESEADPEVRMEALAMLLAHVALQTVIAIEVGEFALRDLAAAAVKQVLLR